MNAEDNGAPHVGGGRPERLLLVSGLSGAGKSSALKILEDMGWEVVDNLPLFLLPALLSQVPAGPGPGRRLAVGIDSRTRDFSPEEVIAHREALGAEPGMSVRLCFLDCQEDVLQRRFTETRRRHPLATDRPVMDGVRHERSWLIGLQDHADDVIDTTDISLPELRQRLNLLYGEEGRAPIQIVVCSFSYKRGLPRDADLVFDVRFLRNPYYDRSLKDRPGTDPEVQAHITADPAWPTFTGTLNELLDLLVPRYGHEGKSYLTICFGCTGGRHRSVFAAETVARRLREAGEHVTVRHRDLDR